MTTIIHLLTSDRPADSQVGQAMRDADEAIGHLIELRNAPDTRNDMAGEEAELWRLKSNLEWLLTSIAVEKSAQAVQAAE